MGAITSIIAGVSLASTAAGAGIQYEGSRRAASAQGDIVALELQAEAQRKKAMEIDARRRLLETVRQQQRANSTALTRASSQGAQFGSALPGSYGQIGGQSNFNLLGIQQGLQIGENLFDINSRISQSKIALSQAQSMYGLGAGISSLGQAIFGVRGELNRLGGNLTGGGGYPGGDPTRLGTLY